MLDTSKATRQYLVVRSDEGDSPRNTPHLFKARASNTAGRFDFMTGAIAPRTGPPLHFHVHQDDTFYVLDAILTVQVEDDIFDVGPRDFLSVPPRVAHTFDNLRNGDKPVRGINLMTPGGHFDMFNEMGGVGPGPDQADTLREVSARHGTIVVGPPLRVTLDLG